ncbi:unnamed protein product, partial [marine sediment metagenome]
DESTHDFNRMDRVNAELRQATGPIGREIFMSYEVKGFDLVAGMLAATDITDGMYAITSGYNVEGIGSNCYRYDADNTDAPDGGVVLPGLGGSILYAADGSFTGDDGLGRFVATEPRYDPALFGADPTGTADSTSIWNAVFKTVGAGCVSATTGTYLVDELTIPEEVVDVRFNDSTLNCTNIAAAYVLRVLDDNTAFRPINLAIRDLLIVGPGRTTDCLGLFLDGRSTRQTFRRIWVEACYVGVRAAGTLNSYWQQLTTTRNTVGMWF